MLDDIINLLIMLIFLVIFGIVIYFNWDTIVAQYYAHQTRLREQLIITPVYVPSSIYASAQILGRCPAPLGEYRGRVQIINRDDNRSFIAKVGSVQIMPSNIVSGFLSDDVKSLGEQISLINFAP